MSQSKQDALKVCYTILSKVNQIPLSVTDFTEYKHVPGLNS